MNNSFSLWGWGEEGLWGWGWSKVTPIRGCFLLSWLCDQFGKYVFPPQFVVSFKAVVILTDCVSLSGSVKCQHDFKGPSYDENTYYGL